MCHKKLAKLIRVAQFSDKYIMALSLDGHSKAPGWRREGGGGGGGELLGSSPALRCRASLFLSLNEAACKFSSIKPKFAFLLKILKTFLPCSAHAWFGTLHTKAQ